MSRGSNEHVVDRRGQLVEEALDPGSVVGSAVRLMTNTAITGAAYDIDGGQRLVD